MTRLAFTPRAPEPCVARITVEVGDGEYHRPGQRDPEHSGWLRSRLDDAQRIAEPCPVCFPDRKDGGVMATIEARLDEMQANAHEKVINMPKIVAALRDLADWADANRDLADELVVGTFYFFPGDEDKFAQIAHHLGGFREKTADSSWFNVTRKFGAGLDVQVSLSRGSVCERVVVGTERVEEVITPAHDKEIVEWRCPPSLLGFEGDEAA